jgi:hypothetical protein
MGALGEICPAGGALHGVLVDFGTTLGTGHGLGEAIVRLVFLGKFVIEEFIARFFKPLIIARHGSCSGLVILSPVSGKTASST